MCDANGNGGGFFTMESEGRGSGEKLLELHLR